MERGTTYVKCCWDGALCGNVTFVRVCSLNVVGIDVVARPLFDALDFDTRMLVGPDVIVAVLRAFLDTSDLDLLGGT